MSFHIAGLAPELFAPLFELDDASLRSLGALRVTAEQGGFPCRVSLCDAAPGDELLLLNFEHQSARSPYRASHAIYVSRSAQLAVFKNDEVAPILANRLLSVRAFDRAGLMVEADVVEGANCADLFNVMLADPTVDYLHAHTARHGCYLARIDRTARATCDV